MSAKIALCVSGALRFDYCEDLRRIVDEVATPLNADVFLFSWDEACLWPGAGGLGVGFLRNFIDENRLKEAPKELLMDNYAFAKLFPQSFALIEQEYSAKISKKALSFIKNLPRFKALALESQDEFMQHYPRLLPIHNSLKMFYGFNRVLELLFSYEKEHNERYDFIILMRPDKHYKLKLSLNDLEKLGAKDLALDISDDFTEAGDVYFFGRRWAMVEFLSTFSKASVSAGEFFTYFPGGINCADYGCLCHWSLARYVSFLGLNAIKGQEFIKWQSASKTQHFPSIKKSLRVDLAFLSKQYDSDKLNAFYDFFAMLMRTLKPVKLTHKYLYYNKALAGERIKATLTYRIGAELILASKNFKAFCMLFYRLFKIAKLHKIEREAYLRIVKSNPKLKLLPLELCGDYEQALKVQEHLSYKLGVAFLKAYYTGGGGVAPLFLQRAS